MLHIICKTISFLPLALIRLIATTIGWIVYFIRGKQSITKQNIALCFSEESYTQQAKLVRKSMIESTKYAFENCFIWNHDFNHNQKYIISTEGMELFNTTTPTILLTPHFGGFEITGRVLSLHREVHFLYRKAKKQSVNDLIFHYRNQEQLIMHEASSTGVRNITKTLKSGGCIGILPDQSPSGASVRSTFFGVPTETTTLLCKLALKYQPTILLTYALRVQGGYKLVLQEINLNAPTLEESVHKMQASIEELVRKYPQQYLWNYKKFKCTYTYDR